MNCESIRNMNTVQMYFLFLKWHNVSTIRNYGYLKDNQENYFFFHKNDVETDFIMSDKTKVIFEIGKNLKGICAIKVNEFISQNT